MNNYLNVLYVIVFFAMFVISMFLLIASNFEKMFKQGKITEIRISYVIASFIISFLFTRGFIEIIERINNILK